MEANQVTIKVLKGLPMAIAKDGRGLLKAFETLFFIKALWKDTPFENIPQTRLEIAELSLRSPKTIERRIKQLKALQLLKGKKYLTPISWDDLREKYGILHAHFYHIKACETVQLEYILTAKVIEEKKRACEKGFQFKRDKNSTRKQILNQVTGNRANAEAVANHQLNAFISEGHTYDSDEAYILETFYHNKEEKILRGDTNVNYGTLKRMFGYKGNGSVAKLKKTLCRKGVITVTKNRFALDKNTHTDNRSRRTRLGYVFFDENLRQLFLIMPDKIEAVAVKNVDLYHQQMKKFKAELEKNLNAKAKPNA